MDGKGRVWRDCGIVGSGIFIAWFLLCSSCFAADWAISPRISVVEEYNDNILYKADNELDDWVTYVRPRVNARYASPRFSISLDSGMSTETYSDHTKFNTEDHDHNLALSYGVSKTLTLKTGGYYREDTTLETELLDEGYLVSNRYDRQKFGGNLGFEKALSKRVYLSGDWTRRYSEYDEGFDDRFSDTYKLSPSYVLSPKTRLFLNLRYTETEYDRPGDPTIENYRIDPSFRHDFAEDFYISGGAGYRHTEEERIGASDEDSEGFVFDLSFHRKWKRSSAAILLSKDQYSTVDRVSIDRTRVTLRGSYRLTKRLGTNLSLTYRRHTVDENDATDDDTNFYIISPGFSYTVTPTISLNGSVDYSEYEYDDDNDRDREQFRGRLMLSLHWPRLFSGK